MTIVKSILVLLIISTAFAAVKAQTPAPSVSPTPLVAAPLKRWVDVETFSISSRYRYVRDNSGATPNDQMQWQIAIRTKFKFDKAGKYSVNAGAFTGSNFTSSWNNLGPGTGKPQSNVYLKQFYFDAKLNKKIEVQIGGLSINSGENSEATTYDNDGYITGERVIIRDPKSIYFDEISATNAYFGDLDRPGIFGRLHRFNESNYRQLLVRKQATKQIGFSADYTFASGTDTFREAIRVKPKQFFLNTILFETYQRVSTPKGYGLGVFGEKVISKHVMVNGGFVRIDRSFTLNGDKFTPGKRVHTSLVFKLRNDVTLSPFIIHAIGDLPSQHSPCTRFDLTITWNVLETLHSNRIF